MLTAISGGIGSGKTVVCRIVKAMGFHVYDCDSRATRIMDIDENIKRRIADEINSECLKSDGSIDRKRISQIVFADQCALQRLNAIVHGAVRQDLLQWYAKRLSQHCFVETAILYQSGIDRMVDDVWLVEAPKGLRIARVMTRNNFDREQVLARISSQDKYTPKQVHAYVYSITNDCQQPLLPQIERLLKDHI